MLRWCRGGGVVASLVYDVSVEYGESVEYDVGLEYGVSLAYDVSFEAVVVGAPKEQKIKKNAI